MKLTTPFLFLILIISIKSRSKMNSFSIDTFKDYLKNNGLFEVIQSIKYAYGQDVAIISCEELNRNCNGNCKKLVTDYMKEKQSINGKRIEGELNKNSTLISSETEEFSHTSKDKYDRPPEKPIKQPLIYWKIMKNSINILYMQDSPKKKFNSIKLKSINDIIRKRAKKRHHILPNDFLNFLHSSIKTNIKHLN